MLGEDFVYSSCFLIHLPRNPKRPAAGDEVECSPGSSGEWKHKKATSVSIVYYYFEHLHSFYDNETDVATLSVIFMVSISMH